MIPLTLATVGALALLLVAEARQHQAAIWVLKPLTSSGFIATALAAGAMESGYGQVILVGLLLGWLGDLLLIRKGETLVFRLGVLAFLLGHLAYVVAFVVRGIHWGWAAATSVPLLVVAAVVLRWLRPHVPQAMRRDVVIYIAVITLMMMTALGTLGHPGNQLIAIGSTAFWLSDLSVARQRFITPAFINRIWGLPAYFGGQLILAWSVAS